MKRPAAVLVAATAAVATIAVGSSSGSAQQSSAQTLTLIVSNRGSQVAAVDNPPTSPTKGGPLAARVSLGDLLVGSQRVYATSGQRVGRVDVSCVATGAGANIGRATYTCTGVYKLKDGTIHIAMSYRQTEAVKAAITGGTGRYEGARGTVTSVENRRGSKDTIELLP